MSFDQPFSRLRRLSLPLAASAIAACSSGGAPQATTSALAEGRVRTDASTMVRAYSVEPDGSLTPASEPEATTADGQYRLDVTLSGSAVALVVRVEDENERATVLGRGAVEAAGSSAVRLAPIDRSSTAMADVYAAAAAGAGADADANLALDAFVAPELALLLERSAAYDDAIAATAGAVIDARETLVAGLTAELDGSAQGDVEQAFDAFARAELAYAAALDASIEDEDARAAYDVYVHAVVEGMIDAGFAPTRVAAATTASETALEANLEGFTSEGRAELEAVMAASITMAIELGAGAALDDPGVAGAGMTLRTSLRWAAFSGSAAEESASWADYRRSLDGAVARRLTSTVTVLDSLHVELDAAALALSSTWAEMGPGVSGSARVDAYARYHAEVTSEANAEALTAAGLTSEQASATLEAMAEVGAASH